MRLRTTSKAIVLDVTFPRPWRVLRPGNLNCIGKMKMLDAAPNSQSDAQVENVLEVNNIEVIYNHVILVLKGVSLNVPKGGITALLGGNGAGKTTTLKAISGLLASERGEVTKGSIKYRGEDIAHADPAETVKKGVVQVMEGRHCFEHLTVEENLLTGAYTRTDGNAAI